MIEYGMNDICKNTVVQQSLKVGNGKNFRFSANQCNEVRVTQPGECITEVTFYRDNRKYVLNNVVAPADMGIVGMAFKTTRGTE